MRALATYETLTESMLEVARTDVARFTNSGKLIRGEIICDDVVNYELQTSSIARQPDDLLRISLEDIVQVRLEHVDGGQLSELSFQVDEVMHIHEGDPYISFFYERISARLNS